MSNVLQELFNRTYNILRNDLSLAFGVLDKDTLCQVLGGSYMFWNSSNVEFESNRARFLLPYFDTLGLNSQRGRQIANIILALSNIESLNETFANEIYSISLEKYNIQWHLSSINIQNVVFEVSCCNIIF